MCCACGPTGNLDDDTSLEVLNLMRRLNAEQAQTFVIVTHDPKVGDFCDRVVRMANARMVADQNGLTTAEDSNDQVAERDAATEEDTGIADMVSVRDGPSADSGVKDGATSGTGPDTT